MITTEQTLKIIEGLLRFRYPQICRHLVVLELFSVLKENGWQTPTGLESAICQAKDTEALEIISRLNEETKRMDG